jgi:ABC-type multidrug transport system fused ATPase/permease subunit
MSNYKDNGKEYKSLDKHLLKRLMVYSKPYALIIFSSLILLIVGVILELYQPVILGTAIDEYIDKYNTIYELSTDSESDGFYYKDHYFIETTEDTSLDTNFAIIVKKDDEYYFLDDLLYSEAEEIVKSKDTSSYANRLASPLTSDELKVLRKSSIYGIIRVSIQYLIITLLIFLISYGQALLLQYSGQKIIFNIRNEIFAHFMTLSIDYFNKNPIGKIVTRVTNDTENLSEMYTSVIINTLKSLFILIGVMISMLLFNIKLSLLTFSVLPFIVLFTMIFRHYSRIINRDIRKRLANLNSFISETISGMKIVQIFAVEDEVYSEFKSENNKLKKSYLNNLTAFATYRPSIYLLNIVALALLVGFGGKMAIQGTISIGTLIIFQRYIGKLFEPIQQLSEQFNILQSAMASSERIFEVLDTESDIKDNEDAIEIENIKGSIEFKNVCFAYNENEWILKNVSFTISPGQTVAFVGSTGAGKTTIQNLITRYYDIQKGEILVDGINIKNIKLESLRTNIGQMLQDVFLFTGDIKSNIRLRNENISMDKIYESSKFVNADKFICKLPDKYSEKVFERGATFSTGQRQLISFARTLAYNPSILILDEATANIDTETESLIQDALGKIMKNRTTLVVAHRLSTIQNADKIIVLHKGQVIENGTHQQLLVQKGMYFDLYKLQYNNNNN